MSEDESLTGDLLPAKVERVDPDAEAYPWHRTTFKPTYRCPLAQIYAGSLCEKPANTRRTREASLRAIVNLLKGAFPEFAELTWESFPWHLLNRRLVGFVMNKMGEKALSTATKNLYLSAMRGIASVAFDEGKMSAEEHQRIYRVKRLSGTVPLRGKFISDEERDALKSASRMQTSRANNAAPHRDAAIIEIMLECGLRRAEVCAIQIKDIDFVTKTLRVRGKGNKVREVPLISALVLIQEWLDLRLGTEPRYSTWPATLKNLSPRMKSAPLFIGIDRWGNLLDEHVKGASDIALNPASIRYILTKIAERAGLENPPAPHDCRRTLATRLYDYGFQSKSIQHQLGHASDSTTQRYNLAGQRQQFDMMDEMANFELKRRCLK